MNLKTLRETLSAYKDKRMNPDSSKVPEDSQYLEPASYDKKVKKEFGITGDTEVSSQDDMDATSDNFKAQDSVKKNTKAPLKESTIDSPASESSVGPVGVSVNYAYEDESLALLEEVTDLIEKLSDETIISGYYWRDISINLRVVRDILLNQLPPPLSEEEGGDPLLAEAFSIGPVKLKDGRTIKLTKEDVNVLNQALSSTNNKNKMINDITENQKNFNDFLRFAHGLNEDFSATIDDLLAEATEEQLEYIADNELSEADSWDLLRSTTTAGAIIGGSLGKVGGGTIGLGLGAGIISAKKALDIAKKVKKWNRKKFVPEGDDSVLGTSAPALDSDEGKKKKEDLQEINSFNYKPARRGTVKWMIQQQAKSGEYEDGVTKPLDDKFKKPLDDKFKKKKKKKEDLQEVNQRAFSRITGIKPIGRTTQSHQFADSIGGDSSNYRNPAEKPIKFSKIETPVKDGSISIITNDKKNIDGPLATKVGDIVNVKFSRVEFYRMKVIEMLPNNKIKVQAFNR